MSSEQIVAMVLLDVAIVVVVAQLMGRLFRVLRQPPVIGEIVGGILLGPTLLGAFPGHLDTVVFPMQVRPYLMVLAQLGLVLFMFIVGLELKLGYVTGRLRTASAVSLVSIALPFALGVVTAVFLYSRHHTVDGREIPFSALALFLGIALSITAFPVLARILTERGMHRTPTGALSLACAAVDDVAAWSLLAVVVAVAGGHGPAEVLTTVALTAAFVAAMLLVVRPQLRRLLRHYRRRGHMTPDLLAIVLVGLLASAWATDAIGIHVIFGAFLFGAALPRAGAEAMNREILDRLEQISVLLLLPMFFVVTGLGVDVGGLGLAGFGELALVLAVAIVGKFAGAAGAARISGLPRRQALALGALMNTRGLTELAILQVGRQMGVLDGSLFTIMVVMAVVTTVMTEPLLRWIYPPSMVRRDVAAAQRRELGEEDVDTVVVLVDDPARSTGTVRWAARLVQPAGRVVLARFLTPARSGGDLRAGPALGAELDGAAEDMQALVAAIPDREVRVTCRFSDDPTADLVTLATELAAGVVVVPEERGGDLDRGPCTVLVPPADPVLLAEADADGPVVVHTDMSPDGRAALKIASRLGTHGDRPVRVVPLDGGRRGLARRWRALSGALGRAELVSRDAASGAGGVVIVPETAPPPVGHAVVRVRAGDVDAHADFEETVAALARTA